MNKHLRAFLMKFIATFAILYLILGLAYGLTIGETLLLSAGLGIVTYLIGDLFILARSNNVFGTIADFAFSWAIIFLFINTFTPLTNAFLFSFLGAVGVTAFEIFFHRYIELNVLPPIENDREYVLHRYQTESAEELDPQDIRTKKDGDRNL